MCELADQCRSSGKIDNPQAKEKERKRKRERGEAKYSRPATGEEGRKEGLRDAG